MVKNNHSFLSQNTPDFLTEKTQENRYKKLQISRTMEWLQIPEKTQKNFIKNFIHIDVDYMQYTCYNIKTPLELIYNILGFSGTIDQDNSNVEYNYNLNLSLTHMETRMWQAYIITFMSPWFPPIPIGSVEVYNPNKKGAIKTEGKIVFYGWYFVFKEIITSECPEFIRFVNAIELWSIIQTQNQKDKPIYKRTRVDIAIDIKSKISQRWMYKYIKPSKNSKHAVKPYNYTPELGWFQSFGYIPWLSKMIGIRVYNKVLDIKAKNKHCYHPAYGTEEIPDVTRIEIIYGWDTAMQKIDTLIDYTKFRILWTDQINMKRINRPKSQYSPLSAYEYFKRYAKNHWKSLKDVLDDVTCIAMIEEQKDMEYKENQYKEIEIFEMNPKK